MSQNASLVTSYAKLKAGFHGRLFSRRSTWPLCQYLVRVSSNAKSLHLEHSSIFCGSV